MTCYVGNIYATHDQYGGCCAETESVCNFPLSCIDNSRVLYADGNTGTWYATIHGHRLSSFD